MQYDKTHYKWDGKTHKITFNNSTSTQQTLGFSDRVTTVRLVSTQDCHVVFDENQGDASLTNGVPLKANVVEYFVVDEGDKCAVIGDSAGGDLEISEMTL